MSCNIVDMLDGHLDTFSLLCWFHNVSYYSYGFLSYSCKSDSNQLGLVYSQDRHMGLNARNPDFVVCEHQRCRPACASVQSDQHLCYSLSGKLNSLTSCMRNFENLASPCSWAGWFEPYIVTISCVQAHIRGLCILQSLKISHIIHSH